MATNNTRAFATGGGLLQGSFANRVHKPATVMLVPMIDIFTVLVTFLLMTAVFSRVAILQLDLPSSDAGAAPSPPEFRLEVIVRDSGFELTNGDAIIATIPMVSGEYDFATLSQLALELKQQHPDVDEASVLMERQVQYDYLIQVMDAIRSTAIRNTAIRSTANRSTKIPAQSEEQTYASSWSSDRSAPPPQRTTMELFTNIAVGEAP